nr:unnamed protein product [Digitaria exilis]
MPASVHAVQGWIRYAFQHGVKSLALDMHLPERAQLMGGKNVDDEEDHKNHLMVCLDGLPSPVRLETMRLALGGARLRPSADVKFASLKDLSLERIKVPDGDARLFACLVSSRSCPNLQKLRIRRLQFRSWSQEMRLEADMLSELWVEDTDLMSLDLRTPCLRVLHIDKCNIEVLGLSAPRLEQVALLCRPTGSPVRLLRVHGDLPCVQSLKLWMWSHHHYRFHGGEQNDSSVLLLKSCSLLKCLEVTLGGSMPGMRYEAYVDLIKDAVPHIPQITSLTVKVSEAFTRHNFGAGVANLLTRFTNLRHLNVHLPSLFYEIHDGLLGDLDCDDHPDHWTSYEISMVHLQEVELTGLTGVDCELWFMEEVLASAKILGKMTIRFHKECCQHKGSMDAFQRLLLDEGMWTSRREEHMITCLK